jgi:hypothetical protein
MRWAAESAFLTAVSHPRLRSFTVSAQDDGAIRTGLTFWVARDAERDQQRAGCDWQNGSSYRHESDLTAMALVMGLASSQAEDKGCIKGAAVGGIAGHFAGHHGIADAVVGCAIGHYVAKKDQRNQETQTR